MKLDNKKRDLLKRYLQFMVGFEESTLYLDYKEAEEFSDNDYKRAIDLIENIANGTEV
jgi:hypothetical protein